MADLVSSVPGIFTALLGLVQDAAATVNASNVFNPPVAVFAFELAQYEPGAYVTVHEIVGPVYEWETIGAFSQYEDYDIGGIATVFTGASVVDSPTVQTDVLASTFSLFQSCVMTPIMSNRTMPYFETTGPSPVLMVPKRMTYSAGPGEIAGGPAGWQGKYEWSFHFRALLTPA